MSIKTDAIVIKNETIAGANTALRVGSNLEAIADNLLIKLSSVDYATYNAMILAGTPSINLIARVLNDENKMILNATYLLYPDGTRLWVASTSDN